MNQNTADEDKPIAQGGKPYGGLSEGDEITVHYDSVQGGTMERTGVVEETNGYYVVVEDDRGEFRLTVGGDVKTNQHRGGRRLSEKSGVFGVER